jgi:hypothetical protein
MDKGNTMNPNLRNLMLHDLRDRIAAQEKRIEDKPELFKFDRNGLRMAIAAIEDETSELYEVWQHNKRKPGNARDLFRWELLDIAAVAMLAYERTFDDPRVDQ